MGQRSRIRSYTCADAQVITRAEEVYLDKRLVEILLPSLSPSVDSHQNEAPKTAEIIALIVSNMTEGESITVGAIDHRASVSCWFDVTIGTETECNVEKPVDRELLTNAKRAPASEIVIVGPRQILEKFATQNLGFRNEAKGLNDLVTYDKKGLVHCLRIPVTPSG